MYLFLTGMFRSGTTLLAKMLDAHSNVSFASDPFRPFFNDYRDYLAEQNNISLENLTQAPLGDYFWNTPGRRIFKIIQSADFSEILPQERLKTLIPIMKKRAEPFSQKIALTMERLSGNSYRDLYASMMSLVQNQYGKPQALYVGHKEVWCTEFIPSLCRTFPGFKAIILIRDPRSVFASNNVTGAKYPWLFLIRQWRKLTLLAWLYSQDPEISNRVLCIRYEDLVQNPENSAKTICSFLKIPFDPGMLESESFRDGAGQSWSQNSSYGTGKKINTQSINKWKDVLKEEEIRHIELLCGLEMQVFSYAPILETTRTLELQEILNPVMIPEVELSKWIRPFCQTDYPSLVTEMLKEDLRLKLWFAKEDIQNTYSLDFLENLFLSKKIWSALSSLKPENR